MDVKIMTIILVDGGELKKADAEIEQNPPFAFLFWPIEGEEMENLVEESAEEGEGPRHNETVLLAERNDFRIRRRSGVSLKRIDKFK